MVLVDKICWNVIIVMCFVDGYIFYRVIVSGWQLVILFFNYKDNYDVFIIFRLGGGCVDVVGVGWLCDSVGVVYFVYC